MRKLVCSAAAATAPVFAFAVARAGADSFAPVQLKTSIASVARLHRPLKVTVHVSADPEALNTGGGTVRAQVKLAAGECGGSFATTPGVVLLDKPLRPQPGTGSYSGSASGSGRPAAYGTQTVCVFIDNDYQKLADDTAAPPQVNVSRACTVAAARYDASRRRRHRHHRSIRRQRRAAQRACGRGVAI